MDINEQERIDAVNQYIRGDKPSDIYRGVNRSEKWLFKWVNRFKTGEKEWFKSRSRAPKQHAKKTNEVIEKVVVNIRKALMDGTDHESKYLGVGADAIQYRMVKLGFSEDEMPSKSTIKRIVKKHGLKVNKRERYKRVKSKKRYTILNPTQIDEIHQMDFVGPRFIKGYGSIYSLNLIDVVCNRVWIEQYTSKKMSNVIEFLIRYWNDNPIPRYLQVDNGMYFIGDFKNPRKFSRVVRLCLYVGIEIVFIAPSSPWMNGSIESFNNWFGSKFWDKETFTDLKDIRTKSTHFVCKYNDLSVWKKRNKELKQTTPVRILKNSAKINQNKLPLTDGKIHFIRQVDNNGMINVLNEVFNVGEEFISEYIWATIYTGKQRMLGRVMNCLENVFIHDSKGHPLYFQTFQGHADLGKEALNMLTKLTELLDDPSAHVHVKRILVMDGGANGVKTLRAFSGSDEYFITILDDNQIKTRKFKHIREERRYKYGNAELKDCKIELLDSKELGYIYECRAVIVKWDNGRKSVLVTDIPRDLLDASEITKKYFDRWPKQEKEFRDAKSGVNIHRIMGYGKKIENYDKMDEKHSELCKAITQLKSQLKIPLVKIEAIDEQLIDLYRQERMLRERSKIIEGKRVLDEAYSTELEHCEARINKYLRQQKAIEKEHKDDFKRLKRYLKEEKRIRDKDKVYKIDTELDQIMTCFKMSFVNLCSLFLIKCMNHERFELQTLFESVFQLGGEAFVSEKEKTIELEMNLKEPKLMDKLNKGLGILNKMNIHDPNGRSVKFNV